MSRGQPISIFRFVLAGGVAAAILAAASGTGAGAPSPPFGKLGIFIHYGPATLLAAPDTVTWSREVWSSDYLGVVARFAPNAAAAASWVAFAKKAGASYLVFVTKHHDGYALWPTNVRFDRSQGASAYRWEVSPDQDVLGAVAAAARAAKLPLYLYYSLPDWYEHSYRVADPARFIPLVQAQLHELLTQYGPVAGVWLDGTYDRPASFWHLDELEQEIRALQPQALIGVNHQPPEAGEGFAILESQLPSAPVQMPTQVAWPLERWWFSSGDPMSHTAVLALEKQVNGLGASLLLDVPPRADGTIAPDDVQAVLGRPHAALPGRRRP